MDVPAKRTKIEFIEVNYIDLPLHILRRIISYLPLLDIKRLSTVNTLFHEIITDLMKRRTFLYVTNENEEKIAEKPINKKIDEIFFHGNVKIENIQKILEKNQNSARKVSFGKTDLKFIKVSQSCIANWLRNMSTSLTVLNTLNIEMIVDSSNSAVECPNLKKLRCCDNILPAIHASNLEDIHIFSTDKLSTQSLENINNFLVLHHSIKKFSYRIYCGDDVNIQNINFKLDHLNLSEFVIAEFRYNPSSVLEILQHQKNLKKLHIEDGYLTADDHPWTHRFIPIFEEIASMKYLNKLVIEAPTINFMRKLKNLKTLARLNINAIQFDVLKEFISMEFPNIIKLCIEGINFGKKALRKEDIWLLSQNFRNIKTFKFDTAPVSVIDCILKSMTNLKEIKILRNAEIIKKLKSLGNEQLSITETSLEKIICEQEDFDIRIYPIVKLSPGLKYVKIYWSNKKTPLMTIIYQIIEYCEDIQVIEFKYNGVYAKNDAIPFRSHFSFSRENLNYQIVICHKNGKIKCMKQ